MLFHFTESIIFMDYYFSGSSVVSTVKRKKLAFDEFAWRMAFKLMHFAIIGSLFHKISIKMAECILYWDFLLPCPLNSMKSCTTLVTLILKLVRIWLLFFLFFSIRGISTKKCDFAENLLLN